MGSLFDLDRYCILELEFWQSNLKIVNCSSFTPKPAATKSFFSDASQLACAAHSGDGKLIAHRMFTEVESSTFRELAAIKFPLEAFELPCWQRSLFGQKSKEKRHLPRSTVPQAMIVDDSNQFVKQVLKPV